MRCLTLLMTCVTLAPIVAGCAASAGGAELAWRPKTLAVSGWVRGVADRSAPWHAARYWWTPWPSSWASVITCRGLPR